MQEQKLLANQLESNLAQAQLKTLQMQIQPHFLFNTLNSISTLLRENVDAADEMIQKLSDMFRYSLTNMDHHEVALEEEIKFLQCYLGIEKIRFQDRLDISFDIDPAVKRAYVPRMILQPLLENSIRHGIAKKAYSIQISIKASPVNGRLELLIQDTGPGIQLIGGNPIHEGMGIKSTRQRLKQHYRKGYTIAFENIDPKGALIKIVMPINLHKNESL